MRALIVEKAEDGSTSAGVQEIDEGRLPEGDVTVAVEYSTVNYKDGMAIVNGKPVIRSYPMVPGIDLAGVVESSDDKRFAVGDRVVLNGWGVGEGGCGGKRVCRTRKVTGDEYIGVVKRDAGLYG